MLYLIYQKKEILKSSEIHREFWRFATTQPVTNEHREYVNHIIPTDVKTMDHLYEFMDYVRKVDNVTFSSEIMETFFDQYPIACIGVYPSKPLFPVFGTTSRKLPIPALFEADTVKLKLLKQLSTTGITISDDYFKVSAKVLHFEKSTDLFQYYSGNKLQANKYDVKEDGEDGYFLIVLQNYWME